MKKICLLMGIFLCLYSCKKEKPIEKEVIVKSRYVAEDGTNALVTLTRKRNENTISIRSNNKTISAKKIDSTAEGILFKNEDIEIQSKDNLLKISQGDHIIELKKARGQ